MNIRKKRPRTAKRQTQDELRARIEDFQANYYNIYYRINDDQGEGLLFKDRSEREDPSTGETGCNVKPLERRITKSLFNEKELKIDGQEIDIISYEAPILRRTERVEKSSKSCDLIGIAKGIEGWHNLIAIEVKRRPGNETDLDHGLWQAAQYGLILNDVLKGKVNQECSREKLNRQVEVCCSKYKRNRVLKEGVSSNVGAISFALAIASEYFAEKSDGFIASHIGRLDKVATYLKDNICREDLVFWGYLVIEGDKDISTKRRHKKQKWCFPKFNSHTISRLNDVSSLALKLKENRT